MFSRKDGNAPQLNRCSLHRLLPLPYILLGTDLQAPPSHIIRQIQSETWGERKSLRLCYLWQMYCNLKVKLQYHLKHTNKMFLSSKRKNTTQNLFYLFIFFIWHIFQLIDMRIRKTRCLVANSAIISWIVVRPQKPQNLKTHINLDYKLVEQRWAIPFWSFDIQEWLEDQSHWLVWI